MGLFCDNIIEIQFFDRLKGAVKKSGFVEMFTNRPPCVKGAVERSETGGLFWNPFLWLIFVLTTIPPSRQSRATSLYTREAIF